VARIAATEDETVLREQGVEVLRGRARFTSRDAVEVSDEAGGTRVRCSRIVIAPGASPAVPPIDGLAGTAFLTTESVFDLTDPPESLASGAVLRRLRWAHRTSRRSDTREVIVVPERPLVIAFDVVETLFPLDPLGERLLRAGQSPELLLLWFARLLRDAFALTASGAYRPFAELAVGASRAVADLSEDSAREVVAGFATLDPHPGVAEAMSVARDAGVRMITLTNGSAATTSSLLERAGLLGHVEQVVSVEAVRRWKPAPEPYRHAAAACGVLPERMALVSAHGWDTHGAHRAGFTTGWSAGWKVAGTACSIRPTSPVPTWSAWFGSCLHSATVPTLDRRSPLRSVTFLTVHAASPRHEESHGLHTPAAGSSWGLLGGGGGR